MKRIAAIFLAVAPASVLWAQSGLITGPFAPGSGSYTTVPGGDFEAENSLAWWNFGGGWANGFGFRETTSAQRGSWGMRMTRGTTFIGYALGQLVPATPGEQYVLSGFFRLDSVWTGNWVGIDVLSGAVGVPQVFVSGLTAGDQGKWFFGWTTFTATSPLLVLRMVNAAVDNNPVPDWANTSWDDIAITPASQFTPVNAVPEPATMAVVGLGLVPFLRKRRR